MVTCYVLLNVAYIGWEGSSVHYLSHNYTVSDTITDCASHLINDGVTVTGDSVRVEWQGTGPSAANQNTEFTCDLDGQSEPCK